jgi:hypothetical protein
LLTTLNNSRFSLEFAAIQIPELGSELVANSRIKSWEFQFANITFLGFHKSNVLYIRNDIKTHAGPTEAKNFKSQLEKQKTSIEKKTTHQTGKKESHQNQMSQIQSLKKGNHESTALHF